MKYISTSTLVLLMASLGQMAKAFNCPHQSRRVKTTTTTTSAKWRTTTTTSLQAAADSDDFSEQEVAKMDDLINSLSLLVEDQERRDKVAQVLGEKLLEPNGLRSSDRFVALFDDRLTSMGNVIREKAAAEAEANNQGGQEGSGKPSEASGKQLWALIDMMVQSKIIFKQAKEDGLV